MCSARFYLDLVKSSGQNPKFISCYRIIKINFLALNMEIVLILFNISTSTLDRFSFHFNFQNKLTGLVFLTAISLLVVIICDKK